MEIAVPGKPKPHYFFDETIKEVASAAQSALPPAPAAKPSMMDYLEQHKVASILNDAVNELATVQPADPFGWLSKKLGEISKAGK